MTDYISRAIAISDTVKTRLPPCDHCGGRVIYSMIRPGTLTHADPRDWEANPHRPRINGMCGACSNNDHSRHRPELPAGANCIGCPCEVKA